MIRRISVAFISTLLLVLIGCSAEERPLRERQAEKLSLEAYVYAYPLITMEMTRRVMTNTKNASGKHAPMNEFSHMREYPNPSFKDVTSANADTLYSIAWVDLSKEPYILHLPADENRYYLMPILSAWTDVIASPGTRTHDVAAEDFVIVGPHWQGKLPAGVNEIKSPTDLIWIIGRTYTTGTPEDYKLVHALQDQYKLIPLSHYGKPYTPPKGVVNSNIDMKTPVRDQVNHLDAQTYFNMLAMLLKNNPPAPDDQEMVETLAKLGIIPGQAFDIKKVDPVIANALENAVKTGPDIIPSYARQLSSIKNDWLTFKQVGTYGNNYLDRAFVAYVGLGANIPEDAIYPVTKIDGDRKPLNGENKYTIHFDKGQMPPVKGFWSLTMYDENLSFLANPLNRYSINARNELKTNPDGSIDLYIQHESPGVDKESNWLPAPAGPFVLMFRFYWPQESLVEGKWNPPAVEKVK